MPPESLNLLWPSIHNIADLHLALGRNYRYLEQYDRAVEEFNRANALNPGDPLPNFYISRTYAAIGEYAKAIQFAEQALKVAPTDPYMYGNLGTMYYKNRQYEDAVKPLKIAVAGGTAETWRRSKRITSGLWKNCRILFHLWINSCQNWAMWRSTANFTNLDAGCQE